jgi:hypothetical protein
LVGFIGNYLASFRSTPDADRPRRSRATPRSAHFTPRRRPAFARRPMNSPPGAGGAKAASQSAQPPLHGATTARTAHARSRGPVAPPGDTPAHVAVRRRPARSMRQSAAASGSARSRAVRRAGGESRADAIRQAQSARNT